ncbi:radical SAM family heme chaperone HemW [Thermoflavimicrobium daqui]|uniref:Heme chaperone HemW n=1 Tax=Thermoflavimicrobium daqui TaxID=2137476 RepID=A0A364K6W6_9BACL|nr:radical SAM family heme chaperone HemW [Thermoflavimicrobium daqui]RAL26046.1 oxygen-independent coproporphyrinogen III oxidase [Thermoflavimicrobium daqui]
MEGTILAPKAVYIHIPFCTNKCHYCDFTAYVVDGQPVDDYITALEQEMELITREVPPKEIDTIFIGGGTPTVLSPKQMERLLTSIAKFFPHRSPTLEFTVEANPGTTGMELLQVMRAGGINRISFGAQTFRHDLLQKIGRIHGVREIEQSVEQARQAGFDNLSLDLMFGLPDQTVDDMKETLSEAVKLAPDHFSCYSLKIEEGTLFHHLYEREQLPLPSEDDELQMYNLIRNQLYKEGYEQYEVSNFAKPGKESKHNTVYWLNEEYYGLGTGAHGYIHKVRYANIKGVKEYIRKLQEQKRPMQESYQVSEREDMENFMILGLRLLKGVSRARFHSLYHKSLEEVYGSVIEHFVQLGLLVRNHDRIKLTDKGLIYGNEVFASFLI